MTTPKSKVSEHLLAEITKYSAMDIDMLGRHIAQTLNHRNEDMIVEMIHIFQWIIRAIRKNILKHEFATTTTYPKVCNGNSLFVNYIYDVQQALCEKGWLCKVMATDSNLSYEEQIDKIWRYLRDHPRLQRWRGRIYQVPVAVLITKIGTHHFCGCSDASPSKP